MPVLGVVSAVASAIEAVAHAAEVPPEVRVSREDRRRAEKMRVGMFHLVDELRRAAREAASIEGPIDTARERRLLAHADKALAKAAGWRLKLVALGAPEATLPTLPTTTAQEAP